jgi:hypothetical protein
VLFGEQYFLPDFSDFIFLFYHYVFYCYGFLKHHLLNAYFVVGHDVRVLIYYHIQQLYAEVTLSSFYRRDTEVFSIK